jgi:hypothetical protein
MQPQNATSNSIGTEIGGFRASTTAAFVGAVPAVAIGGLVVMLASGHHHAEAVPGARQSQAVGPSDLGGCFLPHLTVSLTQTGLPL